MNIYISNLSYAVNDGDLKDLFGEYGEADPELLFTSLEQPFVFYIGKQKLVAGFMGLFNFADLGEKECNLREAFFFSGFSKFRIHGGPFIVFAFGSHLQMFSGRFFQISDKPELDLGMCSFIIGCFSE